MNPSPSPGPSLLPPHSDALDQRRVALDELTRIKQRYSEPYRRPPRNHSNSAIDSTSRTRSACRETGSFW